MNMRYSTMPDGEAMRREIAGRIAVGEEVALAMVDIDSLQSLNETLGAEAGDRVLEGVATILTEMEGPRVYRISGDEFGAVLPGATLEQAFLRMERARAAVETAQERYAVPDGRKVTVGIGVAQCPRDARDSEALVRAADAALASVKEQGRNAVGLPPNEEMVMKSCYYPSGAVRRLKTLAERAGKKESVLLREALVDLLRKYDALREA